MLLEKFRSKTPEEARDKKILFSIAFASFMVNLDTYIVNISIPTIAKEFAVGSDGAAWIALSYQLTIISLLLISGKLGDRFGLKKIFLTGFGIFTAGSMLCGISNSLPALIVSRAVQGAGASVLYALVSAMVPRFLPQEKQATAFGMLATAASLGIIIGSPLGGIITGYLSWQWVFWINVPVGLAAMWQGFVILPNEGTEEIKKSGAFDTPGAVLGAVSPVLFVYALNRGRALGWDSPAFMGMIAVSLLLFYFFLKRENRIASPLIDLQLFRIPQFGVQNLIFFLTCIFLAGNNFLIPFYLRDMLGLSPQQAGIVFMAYPATYMVVGLLAGKMSVRWKPVVLCRTSSLTGLSTILLFSFLLPMNNLYVVIGYFMLLAVTLGIFFPMNNTIFMGLAPAGKRGIVSAVFRLIGSLGLAMGVCVFELVFSAGDHSFTSPAGTAGYVQAYAFGAVLFAGINAMLWRRNA